MNRLPTTIKLNDPSWYGEFDGYSWANATAEIACPDPCKEVTVDSYFAFPTKPKYLLYSSGAIVGKPSAANLQKVLNSMEREMKFPLSRVRYLTKRDKQIGTVLISFSKKWTRSSVLLHLFCLVLRNGIANRKNWREALRNPSHWESDDEEQIRDAEKVITEIVHDKGKLREIIKNKNVGLVDYAELRKFRF